MVEQAPRLERVRLVATPAAEAEQAPVELAGVVGGVQCHEIVEREALLP
jgi:hypothetical protein